MQRLISLSGIFAALWMVVTLELPGQVRVIHLNQPDNKPSANGVCYYLPLTVLRIDVEVLTTVRKSGPLAEYAERFFGIKDAILTDETVHELRQITVSSFSEPDPEQLYYIEQDKKSSGKVPLHIELDEHGILLAVNNLSNSTANQSRSRKFIQIDKKEEEYRISTDFPITRKVNVISDTVIRRINVDTATLEQLDFRIRILDKPGASLAAEIAGKIESLREARYKLITGFHEVDWESGTIRYMDQQLRELEEEYLSLFRGKFYTYSSVYTFIVRPGQRELFNPLPVFTFNRNSGIGKAAPGSPDVVEIFFEQPVLRSLFDTFTPIKGQLAQTGLAYRVPASTGVILRKGQEELFRDRMLISQFGVVLRLPPVGLEAEFSPATGALRWVRF